VMNRERVREEEASSLAPNGRREWESKAVPGEEREMMTSFLSQGGGHGQKYCICDFSTIHSSSHPN